MSNKHFDYCKLVSELAESGWGCEYKSQSEAEEALTSNPSELAAMAMLEMIRRFNRFAKEISQADGGEFSEYDELHLKRSEDFDKPFPDSNIGDFLWAGGLEYGIRKYVIVAKDKDGFVLICETGDFNLENAPKSEIAGRHHQQSLEALVSNYANERIARHSKLTARCRDALAVIEVGGDLSGFIDGIDDE